MENQENKSFQKKNSKKGVIAIIAVIAVIALAVGIWGIYAYLTDRQSATNTFTVGQVSIELLEPSWVANNATELTANQELAKDPQIKNIGSNPAYVYLKVEIPKEIIRRNSTTKEELFTVSYNGTVGVNTTDWDLLNETVGEDSVVRVYYYKTNNGILNANATTNPLFDTIKLANITDGANLEGQSLDVQVDAYAIQSNNLDIPDNLTTTDEKANYAWEKYWAQDTLLNQLTVTFNTNGGSTVNSQSVDRGNQLAEPIEPTKSDGYIFEGWYKESTFENLWDFNTDTVTGNITLYAKWVDGIYFQMPPDWYGTTVYAYLHNSAINSIEDNQLPKNDTLRMTLKDSNKKIYQYKLTQSNIDNINNYDRVIFYNDGYTTDDNDLTERRTIAIEFSPLDLRKIFVPELYNSDTNMRIYGYATNLYEYLWKEVNGNKVGDSNDDWPGVQMINDTVDGVRFHQRIIDVGSYNRMIINNGNKQNQSENIAIPLTDGNDMIAQDLTFKISNIKVEPDNINSKVYYYRAFRCIYDGSWHSYDTWNSTEYSIWISSGDGAKFSAAQTTLGYK